MTPKQIAYDLAMGWIKAVALGQTSDLDELAPAKRRDTIAALSKIHNQLLADSKLDGIPLYFAKRGEL